MSLPGTEQMTIMHNMCEKELRKLLANMERFLASSEQTQKLLSNGLNYSSGVKGNMFTYLAFDRYMAQLTTVLNLARKFNIHFQFTELPESVFLGEFESTQIGGVGCCAKTRIFQDFLQWSKLGRNNCEDEIGAGVVVAGQKAIESSPERIKSKNASLIRDESASDSVSITDEYEYLQTILPKKNLAHFKEGFIFLASVTHVKERNAFVFYVCESNDCKILFQISCIANMESIHNPWETNKLFLVSQKKTCGEINKKCVWRAVRLPLKFCDNPNSALLIDFGEVIVLTDEYQFFEIPLNFANIPPLAIQCILEGVSESAEGEIIKDHVKCKKALISSEYKMAKLKVLSKDSSTLRVILITATDSKEIKSEGKISSLSREELPKTMENKCGGNPFLDSMLFEDYMKEDNDLDPLPLPKSLVYNENKSPLANGTEEGCIAKVTVTHVLSPVHFYGVLEDSSNKNSDVFFWNDLEIPQSQRNHSKPLQEGDIILARYKKDNHWYRAKIAQIITPQHEADENLYNVFYIDFGNTELVSATHIATCNSHQKKAPPQASFFRIAEINLVHTAEQYFSNVNTPERYPNKRLDQAHEAVVVILLNQTINVKLVKQLSRRENDEYIVEFTDDPYSKIPTMLMDLGVVKEI